MTNPAEAGLYRTETTTANKLLLATTRSGKANRRYYDFFAGRRVVNVSACAEEWFIHATANTPDFWVTESCNEMRRLRAQGDEPVLVSGSLTEILQPIARSLGIKHILAT